MKYNVFKAKITNKNSIKLKLCTRNYYHEKYYYINNHEKSQIVQCQKYGNVNGCSSTLQTIYIIHHTSLYKEDICIVNEYLQRIIIISSK